jgi:TetR/AcrR family transcriptional regulator, transcriptional repressor for nem operon
MAKPNVKQQLVTSSLNLLHSKGFNATSVQDITDAAGVPKGSFYNHFASKDALGLEVLQRYIDVASQVSALLQDDALPARERIRNYYTEMCRWNAAGAFERGCLLGNFSTELSQQIPAIRVQLQQAYDGTRALLEGAIADGQRTGDIGTALPASELAAFIVDAWQGAVLRSKTEQNAVPLDRFIHIVLTRILA